MAVDTTAAAANNPATAQLNQTVQQHARALCSQLSQGLSGDAASSSNALTSCTAELRQLVGYNAKLTRALAGSPAVGSAEDEEELHTSCQQRQELLQELLNTLDSSSQGLRTQLDACHKLLATPPCKEDPESIIRYAHTLRHGFAPLGAAPNLPPIPPAPQLPFMLYSTLRKYQMDLAAQQQQQQAGGTQQQPQQQLPAPPAGTAQQQQQQEPGAAAPPAAAAAGQQQPQQQQPAGAAESAPATAVQPPAAAAQPMQFRLNEDLDEGFDIGETASEEESWSDDDESDTE